MNITYPPHKNVTIPLRRRGGPSGHGRVGVVPADPAPRQFECPPKADVSRTTVVTAFSAITSRYTLLSSRTRSDACPNFIKSVPVSSSVFPQQRAGKMYREPYSQFSYLKNLLIHALLIPLKKIKKMKQKDTIEAHRLHRYTRIFKPTSHTDSVPPERVSTINLYSTQMMFLRNTETAL